MKNIVIINGHPDIMSFCHALTESYANGAHQAKNNVITFHLHQLKFDPILHNGYRTIQELEPDLILVQNAIKSADHVVFVYPNWWGTYPALLKGFFDRAWLSGFGFKYVPGKMLPNKLLTGKTARIIMTMNTPKWYYRWFYGRPGIKSVRDTILAFSGIGPTKITQIGMIKGSDDKTRAEWLKMVEKLGYTD